MSNVKNGVVGWGEPSLGGGKSKNDFLRLNPGSNLIRLLTLPHQYHQHRYEPAGGKKYGYRINCSRSETEEKCPLCEMSPVNKAKRRWFVGVIDRKTGTYRTLDIGYSVFKSIQTLAKGPWGSPEGYDLDIVVDPNGGATNYYYVSPMPPMPLTADDIRLQEENPAKNLAAKVEAPSPSFVQDRLNKIQDEINAAGGATSTDGGDKSSASDDEEEGDSFFKNYDNKKKAVNG
jgi:hypothetical protein